VPLILSAVYLLAPKTYATFQVVDAAMVREQKKKGEKHYANPGKKPLPRVQGYSKS
jgi:hypothetical protein